MSSCLQLFGQRLPHVALAAVLGQATRQRLQMEPLDLQVPGNLVAVVEGGGDTSYQLAILSLSGEIPAIVMS